MNPKYPTLLALCLALAGLDARADDLKLSATECQVWERESSFAQSVARHDAPAFAAHVHEGAVFGAASPQTRMAARPSSRPGCPS